MKTRSSFFHRVWPLALSLGMVGLITWMLTHAGVTVKVTNATGTDISDLRIKFTGGLLTVSKLKHGESYSKRVNPNGESDLAVEFLDASGERRSSEIDVYFEGNFSGSVDITIGPKGKVEWKDTITTWMPWRF